MTSHKEAPAIVRADRATDPSEFRRMAKMPARDIATRLSTFQLAEHTSLKVEANGKAIEAIDEDVQFALGGKGNWHALRENSREQGIEAWWNGEFVTVRMRYGKPIRRRPEGNEVDRLREDLLSGAGAHYELVERFAALRDDGRAEHEKRPVRRVAIALSPSPLPAEPIADPSRAWREKITLESLSGKAAIDERTGVLLSLELKARGRFPREGGDATIDLQLRREIVEVGQVLDIYAPKDAEANPSRARHEIERRELLEGLHVEKRNGR